MCTENRNRLKHAGQEGGRRDPTGPQVPLSHPRRCGRGTDSGISTFLPLPSHLYEGPTGQSHWEGGRAQEGLRAPHEVSSSAPGTGEAEKREGRARKEGRTGPPDVLFSKNARLSVTRYQGKARYHRRRPGSSTVTETPQGDHAMLPALRT